MISAQAKKILLATVLMFAFTDAAFAAPRTVTLSVPGMYCAVCPITVKKALEKVPGVSQVNVSFEKKEAVVTFDDAKTNIKALEDATFDAGYPSTVQEEKAK
ncbi:mercury resistance system periplasmic binding protein MerP [Halothiobacillus sp.]|uniref:mercury resistance system periplasmic binding protein MerP n=1 Tax=Halothiobacillus sp. TaxID=1891311 RepID=UPI0026309694|nr:mercury resistance system periplasmic binding protein MerP [Halothiobacillus sp.]